MLKYDVLLQAGHQGRKTGATGAASKWGSELDINPRVVNAAVAVLRAHAITVYHEDAFTEPAQVKLALAIHCNGTPHGTSGPSIGFDHDSDGPFMRDLKAAYAALFPYKDRWEHDNYTPGEHHYYAYRDWITAEAEGLLEMCDLDNEDQAKWVTAHIQEIGELIAKVIVAHLKK